jgi:FkbM family methyltransferase
MNGKKNLIFIGANDMSNIRSYVPHYQNAIFVEAIPSIYDILMVTLESINKSYNTNYIGSNCLVSEIDGKEYSFNVFSNKGASSSLYKANPKVWKWPHVTQTDTLSLKATTVEQIIKKYNWNHSLYDVILDVQGAELDVLKGFGSANLKNVETLTTEISTKPYYEGGVLFKDLNNYLQSEGFILKTHVSEVSSHCDVVYIRK